MILTILYFLFLFMAAAEDYRYHTVRPQFVFAVGLIGILNCITKEDRWVTLALTCVCFFHLFLFYQFIQRLAEHYALPWKFGGADVRLIPGMMLMQGWDVALAGIFFGLVCLMLCYLGVKKKTSEIPLVPWMAAGSFCVELLRLLKVV